MSRARSLYLVMATTSYEGSDPVKAFQDKGEAEALAQKCRDHEAKRPRVPELNEPDADWDKYYAKEKRWDKTHPARPYIGRESYSVCTVPYVTRNPKTQGA